MQKLSLTLPSPQGEGPEGGPDFGDWLSTGLALLSKVDSLANELRIVSIRCGFEICPSLCPLPAERVRKAVRTFVGDGGEGNRGGVFMRGLTFLRLSIFRDSVFFVSGVDAVHDAGGGIVGVGFFADRAAVEFRRQFRLFEVGRRRVFV